MWKFELLHVLIQRQLDGRYKTIGIDFLTMIISLYMSIYFIFPLLLLHSASYII